MSSSPARLPVPEGPGPSLEEVPAALAEFLAPYRDVSAEAPGAGPRVAVE